jgi:hypothetical protein
VPISNPPASSGTSDAGALTGTTLAANVVTSSLTSVGTLSTLAVTGDVTVADEAYGVGWNSSLEVPTKNALYDKIETLGAGGVPTTITVADTTDTTAFVALFESATGDLGPKTDAGLTYNATTGVLTAIGLVGPVTGNVTGNVSGTAATVTGAAQIAITSLGTLTTLQVDNLLINGNDISSTAGTDLTLTPLAGQQIVLDGTIVIDAGVVTGATSISSTAFVGDVTGNVTGNASGTAATVTGAAQTAITSLGTLTALQVDNLNLDGNTISATSGAINITPLAGSAIVLDGTISVDAGVVTGGTSITSTTFVGALTGTASGNLVSGGALGTPSSGVATNLTGTAAGLTAGTVTTNANLTGPVTSVGNATTIAAGVVTLAMQADLAQDQFIGRTTASTGVPQTTTITAAARTVLDDTTVGAMLTTLGGQPVDATLTALAAYNTAGLLTQTAADTFTGRTITGTGNQIVVVDGDGVAGNPTLSLPQNFHTAAEPTFGGMTVSRTGASASIALDRTDSGGALCFGGAANGSAVFAFQDDGVFSVRSEPRTDVTAKVLNTGSLRMVIDGATGGMGLGVTSPTAVLHLKAGTATANTAPVKLTAGTILTAAEALTFEHDGVQFYHTIDTTSGRGAIPVEQYFHLTAAGSTISTIANFFGATSNIAIVASAYYVIDVYCWFLNTTAGTVTWTFTNSAAPTSQDVFYEMSPITGIVAPPGTATMLQGQIYNDATAALAITTGTLTTAVNHYMHTRIYLKNSTGTSLKIQATKNVGGTITPGIHSYWIARRLSPNNIGTFVA